MALILADTGTNGYFIDTLKEQIIKVKRVEESYIEIESNLNRLNFTRVILCRKQQERS